MLPLESEPTRTPPSGLNVRADWDSEAPDIVARETGLPGFVTLHSRMTPLASAVARIGAAGSRDDTVDWLISCGTWGIRTGCPGSRRSQIAVCPTPLRANPTLPVSICPSAPTLPR